MLADLEKRFFGHLYEGIAGHQPIFVTSLPRAGTTLLLEALHRFSAVATHSYRDMPFLMAPLIWARLTGSFRKSATLSERAHGDGMTVGFDSPEAFEEIIWHAFWPEKYGDDLIYLWDLDDAKEEARAFFSEHMRKIIALRRPERPRDGRYLSKNNANIARLGLIRHMFPDSTVVVVVRNPWDHAASLLRQHLNFATLHGKEPFTRRYMADLGHFEFGDLHKPFAFSGLELLLTNREPKMLDYWLAYWIAAFDHVLAHRESVIVLSYEATCRNAGAALQTLSRQLGILDLDTIDKAVELFRNPVSSGVGPADFDPVLRARAQELHDELLRIALPVERMDLRQ